MKKLFSKALAGGLLLGLEVQRARFKTDWLMVGRFGCRNELRVSPLRQTEKLFGSVEMTLLRFMPE